MIYIFICIFIICILDYWVIGLLGADSVDNGAFASSSRALFRSSISFEEKVGGSAGF